MIHSLKWVMPKSREAVDLWSPTALILQHKSRHSVTFTFIWFEAKTLKLMWRSYLSLFETKIEVCPPVSNESLRCSLYWELFTRWSTVFWYSDIYALFAFLQKGGLKKNNLENKFLKSHRNFEEVFVEYVFFLQRWWSLLSCRYVTVGDFNISWRWLVLLRSVGKHIYSSPAYQCLHHTTLCSISSNPKVAYWKRYEYSAVQNSLQERKKIYGILHGTDMMSSFHLNILLVGWHCKQRENTKFCTVHCVGWQCKHRENTVKSQKNTVHCAGW